VPVLGSSRLCADKASREAEDWTVYPSDRRDLGRGCGGAAEAAAHGQAYFRAPEIRARVRRRLFGRERLCAHRQSPGPRDVCAAGASARPCAGGFWRSDRRDRRRAPEDARVFYGSAAFGCAIHEGPAETTEAFLDGHVSAFAFFGGIPRSILYDNTKLAEAKICGDGKRERTRAFSGLISHYLFRDRFGRPGKGNDKGKVEGLVKNGRRRFLTPVPVAGSFEALNAKLEADCLSELDRCAGRHAGTIGARLEADLAAFRPLPSGRFEPCEHRTARVSSTALVRYRMSDYSVPTAYGFREVIVKGFVDQVVILCAGQEIARHQRSYQRGGFICDPLHYLALIEQKPGALDEAAPLQCACS
jgi:hypothetical protein